MGKRGTGPQVSEVCAGPTELNGADLKDCVSNHSLSSNASLPSVQSCRRLRERRVASWAVSFERLLQDPLGVRYFSVSLMGSGHLLQPAPGQGWAGQTSRPPASTPGAQAQGLEGASLCCEGHQSFL